MKNIKLNVNSIISAFLLSKKKHLFLTGTRGSGKTTLLNELTNLLTGTTSPSGITTSATPFERVILKENNTTNTSVIGLYNKKMELVKDGFLLLGIPALKRAMESDEKWITIDELGFLESDCPEFQDTVRSLLNKKQTITVIRKQDTPFLNELKNRSDVFLYDLDNPVLPIGCIIMASGLGKRFGSNKLLADLDNKPLIEWSLEKTATSLFEKTIVVTRHKEIVSFCEQKNIEVLFHDLPNRNDTVHLGLTKLLKTTAIQGCLFYPADQPLVSKESLETMALTFSKNLSSIVRLSHNKTAGSPVLFGKPYFSELLNLPTKKGGGFLTKKYPEQIQLVPARNKYELFDIDTKEDLETIRQLLLSPLEVKH